MDVFLSEKYFVVRSSTGWTSFCWSGNFHCFVVRGGIGWTSFCWGSTVGEKRSVVEKCCRELL